MMFKISILARRGGGQVNDDTGGDDNDDTPEGRDDDSVTAVGKDIKKDKAVPVHTEGGEAVPISDITKAGKLRFKMSKRTLLARRGGWHNETCGCAFST